MSDATLAPIEGPWARLGEWLMFRGLAVLRWWTKAREHTWCTAEGVSVRYLRIARPGKPVAVLIHGFSDRPESFLLTASRLRDYDVILPELPGFHDGAEVSAFTVDNYAKWLAELLDALGLSGAHVCGNSLGGATGLVMAERRPDLVRSLIPLDAGGVDAPGVSSIHAEVRSGHNLFEVRAATDVDAFLCRVFYRQPPLRGPLRAFFVQELARKADVYARIMSDLAKEGEVHHERGSVVELGALDLPVLVAWGDSDSLFPVQVGEYMAEQIPRARLHVFVQTGHCPHIERPLATARLCTTFWSEVA